MNPLNKIPEILIIKKQFSQKQPPTCKHLPLKIIYIYILLIKGGWGGGGNQKIKKKKIKKIFFFFFFFASDKIFPSN